MTAVELVLTFIVALAIAAFSLIVGGFIVCVLFRLAVKLIKSKGSLGTKAIGGGCGVLSTLVAIAVVGGCAFSGSLMVDSVKAFNAETDDPSLSYSLNADVASASGEETTTAATTDGTTDEEESEEDKFADDAFLGDLNLVDLPDWLDNHGWKMEAVAGCYSRNSWPSNTVDRQTKVKEAMQEHGFGSTGFSDPVSYPRTIALNVYRDYQSWLDNPNESAKAEDLKMIKEQDIFWEILTNSVYMDMVAQACYQDDFIRGRNPWLETLMTDLNDAYARTEKPIGNAHWIDMDVSKNSKLIFKTEYVLYAARLCEIMETFEIDMDHPIMQYTSVKNWNLMFTADANTTRTAVSGYQEKLPAIILRAYYKDGSLARLWGVNLFDGRIEIFNPNPNPPPKKDPPVITETTQPTTTTPPPETTPKRETTTTPTETTTEITETTRKTAILTIKYKYVDDRSTVYDRSGKKKFDFSMEVPVGYEFAIKSPLPGTNNDKEREINRRGYHFLKSTDWIVEGTVGENGYTYTVWYEKNAQTYVSTTTAPPPETTPNRTTTSPATTTTPPHTTEPPRSTTTTVPTSDGRGAKDPSYDHPASSGMGSNKPEDKDGETQPTEPPRSDHETSYSQTTVPTSHTDITTTGPSETVHNGTVPDLDPLPTVTGDIFIDSGTDSQGNVTTKANTDTGVHSGHVGKPS